MQKQFTFPIKPPYRITQKFAQTLLDYSRFGMKGHNGLDIAVSRGTAILAPTKGFIGAVANPSDEQVSKGYGRDIRLVSHSQGNIYYDHVFGHLLKVLVKDGQEVEEGDIIGLVDSTGFSTGDHLHYGIRMLELNGQGAKAYQTYLGKQYAIFDYDNGYFGYIDPAPFFENTPDEVSPVDILYGQNRSVLRETSWKILHQKYAKERARKVALSWDMYGEKLMKAFVYGYWDADTVFDPAMVVVWENMPKPEYLKRIGKL